MSTESSTPSSSRGADPESEERFKSHFEQSPRSVQLLSPEGLTLAVNQAWKELWGFPEEVVRDYILKEYNVLKDPQLSAKGILPYIEKGFSGESTRIPPILYDPSEMGLTGARRWVSAFIYPIKDRSGNITEIVLTHEDVTGAIVAEEELRRSRDQLKIIFEGLADGVLVQDSSFRCVYANEAGARMCGFPSGEAFCNASITELLEKFEIQDQYGKPLPADRLPARMALSGARGAPEAILQVRDRKTGKLSIHTVSSRPVLNASGVPYLAVSIFRDITEEKLHAERREFLNEATQILASSLEYQETLRKIAELIVPRLADWCSIDVIENDRPTQVAVVHQDPHFRKLAQELRTKYPPDWNAPQGSPNVIRTGQSEIYPEIPDEVLARAARDEEHLNILRKFGLESAMVVPLKAKEKVLGAITFVWAETVKRYTPEDLRYAEDLASRAALALDHSQLATRLQEAVRARDEFISICSHELKTPITSMKLQFQMAAKQLEQKDANALSWASVEKRTRTANHQLERMAHLINEMLDVSLVSAGKFEVRMEKVDLQSLVKAVVDRFGEQFTTLGIPLVCEMSPDPILVTGDQYRLEQVLSNLLTNAVKYGAGKPVKVAVTADAGTARLVVSDQGMGIAPESLQRIFERFERAVSASHISGLGLGLYISRKIVEAHAGRIWVESTLGQGSAFVVEIPIQRSE